MNRVYNFSAGPAALPEQVLKKAAGQMLDYENSGMSVMEMSHRGKIIEGIMEKTECLIRELMPVPDNYSVLFMQGGASMQFYMIPLNFLTGEKIADYINTGVWSQKAIDECAKLGMVNVAASGKDSNFMNIPKISEVNFNKNASYIHITDNNTVYGTKYTDYPVFENVPLIADMSSSILSEPVDVSKFGLIYAGAQKNMGPAGLTTVIVDNKLLERSKNNGHIATMLNYNTYVKSRSLYNTPPTYAIYITMLVLEWVRDLGGVAAMAEINRQKAKLLYEYLDESKIFTPFVKPPYRSLMNVTYALPNDDITAKFIKEAEKNGLVGLKGYRAVGGIRASIYNAMPLNGVIALIDFMKKFEINEAKDV